MIVIKLGGAALKATLADPALFAAMATVKQPLVIVHGGGPEINQLCAKLGLKFEFVDGQRVTTPAVMEAVQMVLTGKINPELVRGFHGAGRAAVGVSGVSAGLLECVEENPALGLVGRVERVNVDFLRSLLAQNCVPVISPVGLFADGRVCNVNADLATAQIASALGAERLLFLTDRDGILDAEGGAIKKLSLESLQALTNADVISGGMKVKARAILETLQANPTCRVEVMNGLNALALSRALTADETQGTQVVS